MALLGQAWALLKGVSKMLKGVSKIPKEMGTACRMAAPGALVAQ